MVRHYVDTDNCVSTSVHVLEKQVAELHNRLTDLLGENQRLKDEVAYYMKERTRLEQELLEMRRKLP